MVEAAKHWAEEHGWVERDGAFYITVNDREHWVMCGTWEDLARRLRITDALPPEGGHA